MSRTVETVSRDIGRFHNRFGRKKVFREGLYLMLVAGDVLEMSVPEGELPWW